MNLAALLLLLIAPVVQVDEIAAKRPLIVFVDGNRESRILTSELTRDWAVRPSAELAVWEARRQRVASRVQIVDLTVVAPHKRPAIALPATAWGEFGRPEPLDSRSFNGSGCALTCVETAIHNFDLDLTEWKRYCEVEVSNANWNHASKVVAWLAIAKPEEAAAINWYEFGWVVPEELEKLYGSREGYPKFVPPVLPPSPIRRFPWENR